MKYMTKEWYMEMQKGKLSLMKIPENIGIFKGDINNIFENEYKKQLKNKKNLPKGVFEEIYNRKLKYIKENFKENVLKNIRDIRLLALNKVFQEEYSMVKKEIIRLNPVMGYEFCFEQVKEKIPKTIRENLYFHDSKIINIIKEKEKLIICLGNSEDSYNVNYIILEDYEIIEEDFNFINGWYLYEEIYLKEDGYELHILIDKSEKEIKLGYFTIKAKDIVIK